MFGLGFSEILVIMVVILVVVGPDKLPQFAQTLGRTMWQLRRAAEEFKGEMSSSGFNFDAGAIRREVNELKSLLADDSRRISNQIISPPPVLAAPDSSQPLQGSSDTQTVSNEGATGVSSAEGPAHSTENTSNAPSSGPALTTDTVKE